MHLPADEQAVGAITSTDIVRPDAAPQSTVWMGAVAAVAVGLLVRHLYVGGEKFAGCLISATRPVFLQQRADGVGLEEFAQILGLFFQVI